MKSRIIEAVIERKLIAIIRGIYGEDCLNLARALCEGGISLMEVTFDLAHPESFIETLAAIRAIRETLGEKTLTGAGTVTTQELAESAHKAGAQFIVSPNVSREVIAKANELGMVTMPGAMTPTEILEAHRSGADFVKVFPCSVLGSGYIRAIRGPLNHIRLLAVGGVSEANVAEFLEAGALGVGVGGNLASKQWVAAGRFDEITRLAARYFGAVRAIKS